MALIQTVTPDQADGPVAQIYQEIQQAIGFVPNALQVYSANPMVLSQQWVLLQHFLAHPTLSSSLLAMTRLLIAQRQECAYCVSLNTSILMQMAGLSAEQVAALRATPSEAPLDEKDKAMLLYVVDAMNAEQGVDASRLQALRDLGWSELDVLDALTHGARMMATDRVISALQVQDDA